MARYSSCRHPVTVLNPVLYQCLVQRFDDVEVVKQGVRERARYVPDTRYPGRLGDITESCGR